MVKRVVPAAVRVGEEVIAGLHLRVAGAQVEAEVADGGLRGRRREGDRRPAAAASAAAGAEVAGTGFSSAGLEAQAATARAQPSHDSTLMAACTFSGIREARIIRAALPAAGRAWRSECPAPGERAPRPGGKSPRLIAARERRRSRAPGRATRARTSRARCARLGAEVQEADDGVARLEARGLLSPLAS